MIVEKDCDFIFQIVHEGFKTDDTGTVTSLVHAENKEEALKIYNELALTRTKYPYFWNQVTIDAVSQIEVIMRDPNG